PCKIKDPAVWATVDASKISRLTAADLGEGPWGHAASPTSVGDVRVIDIERQRMFFDGPLDVQVDKAMAVLHERNAFDFSSADQRARPVPGTGGAAGGPIVAVLVEPSRTRSTRELLGAAAGLAQAIAGHVVAIGPTPGDDARLAAWGADAVVAIRGSEVEEDIARAVTEWCATVAPWGRPRAQHPVGPRGAFASSLRARGRCHRRRSRPRRPRWPSDRR
ncbi:MAG: hypothetical protein ABIQ73_08600, partial [Acidimicrobiales bacterium]